MSIVKTQHVNGVFTLSSKLDIWKIKNLIKNAKNKKISCLVRERTVLFTASDIVMVNFPEKGQVEEREILHQWLIPVSLYEEIINMKN